MTNDIISREAAIHAVNAYDYRGFTVEDVKIITDGCAEELRKLPSIDAKPMRHGRWFVAEYEHFNCSLCGQAYFNECDSTAEAKRKLANGDYYKFCPHCGAKMDLEESDGNA